MRHCRRDKGDHMGDLFRCCQALDRYRRDERSLFSAVLVKRVSMPVSVVPGATTLRELRSLQLPVLRILSFLHSVFACPHKRMLRRHRHFHRPRRH